jgi:hypothetical protein
LIKFWAKKKHIILIRTTIEHPFGSCSAVGTENVSVLKNSPILSPTLFGLDTAGGRKTSESAVSQTSL